MSVASRCLGSEIRLARKADVGDIFHIRTSVTENALSLAELAEMGITETNIADVIQGAPCAWVAVVESQVVGFSMIDPQVGSLFAAFVLPSHEGNGIGKRLVNGAESALFKTHETIWLETGRNTRAAGFYRHLGWGHEQDVGGGDIRLEKCRA